MNPLSLLSIKDFKPHPLFKPDLFISNTYFLDFSAENSELRDIEISSTSALNQFVTEKISKAGKFYGYGGYLEKRHIYQRGSVFHDGKGNFRNIHLGADIWAPENTPIHAPLDGVVHSFANNENLGDYGPTILLQHTLERHNFFTLYGHLSKRSLKGLKAGHKIKAGDEFCTLGDSKENGQWPPHLHFQVIFDLMGKIGDFPGVCMESEKEYYSANCPDPYLFFKNLQA